MSKLYLNRDKIAANKRHDNAEWKVENIKMRRQRFERYSLQKLCSVSMTRAFLPTVFVRRAFWPDTWQHQY